MIRNQLILKEGITWRGKNLKQIKWRKNYNTKIKLISIWWILTTLKKFVGGVIRKCMIFRQSRQIVWIFIVGYDFTYSSLFLSNLYLRRNFFTTKLQLCNSLLNIIFRLFTQIYMLFDSITIGSNYSWSHILWLSYCDSCWTRS